MQYQKEDMIGGFYQWGTDDLTTRSDRSPSRRAFDRFNGHHVLYVINYYMALSNTFSKEYCQKLEKMICDDLPLEARSEVSVINWISISTQENRELNSLLKAEK